MAEANIDLDEMKKRRAEFERQGVFAVGMNAKLFYLCLMQSAIPIYGMGKAYTQYSKELKSKILDKISKEIDHTYKEIKQDMEKMTQGANIEDIEGVNFISNKKEMN